MSRREDVLKPFERKKSFMEDRIANGIETNRKGFFRIRLKDEAGNPVRNAHVEIRQKSHEFKYGANLFMLEEFNEKEQNQAYRQFFADAFNYATLPFYWCDLEPEEGKPRYARDSPKIYRRPAPDLCLEYCEENGIEPKVHCLNYAAFSPAWALGDLTKEKRLLEKRCRELAERYRNRITDWEVTNETFWGCFNLPHFSSLYASEELIEWSFETAARYFPANRLIINESNGHIWGNCQGFRSEYYLQIDRALRCGARIDSIGMQYHMFHRAEVEAEKTALCYDPEWICFTLDCYAKLGRNIQITELTIPAYSTSPEDEDIQAEIVRNLYRLWFSHPAMEGIVYWNLIDGFAAFAPQGDMSAGENYYHGGLLRYDFTPKKAYYTIRDLFRKEWHTELTMNAEDGEFEFKGFYGGYELEITADGRTVTQQIDLKKRAFRNYSVTV